MNESNSNVLGIPELMPPDGTLIPLPPLQRFILLHPVLHLYHAILLFVVTDVDSDDSGVNNKTFTHRTAVGIGNISAPVSLFHVL